MPTQGFPYTGRIHLVNHNERLFQNLDGIAICTNTDRSQIEPMRMKTLENGKVILESMETNRNLRVMPDGTCEFYSRSEKTFE